MSRLFALLETLNTYVPFLETAEAFSVICGRKSTPGLTLPFETLVDCAAAAGFFTAASFTSSFFAAGGVSFFDFRRFRKDIIAILNN
jgi:hypothetical protein